MKRDIRDDGRVGSKDWQEFRVAYAGARLFAWFLGELTEVAPDYVLDLKDRLSEAIAQGDQRAEDDPEYDGAAILKGPSGGDVASVEADVALLLQDQRMPLDRRRLSLGAHRR